MKGHKGNPAIHSNSAYGADTIRNVLLKVPDTISFKTQFPEYKKIVYYGIPLSYKVADYKQFMELLSDLEANLNYNIVASKEEYNDQFLGLFKMLFTHLNKNDFDEYINLTFRYWLLFGNEFDDYWMFFWMYFLSNTKRIYSDTKVLQKPYLHMLILFLYYFEKRGKNINEFLALSNIPKFRYIREEYYKWKKLYDNISKLSDFINKYNRGYIFEMPKDLLPIYRIAILLKLMNDSWKEWSEADKENYILMWLDNYTNSCIWDKWAKIFPMENFDKIEQYIELLNKYIYYYQIYDTYQQNRQQIKNIITNSEAINFDEIFKIKKIFEVNPNIKTYLKNFQYNVNMFGLGDLLQLLALKERDGKQILSNNYIKAYLFFLSIMNAPLLQSEKFMILNEPLPFSPEKLKDKTKSKIRNYLIEYLFLFSLLSKLERKYGIKGLTRYFDKSLGTTSKQVQLLIKQYKLENEMKQYKQEFNKIFTDLSKLEWDITSNKKITFSFIDSFINERMTKKLPSDIDMAMAFNLDYNLFSYYSEFQKPNLLPLDIYMDDKFADILGIVVHIPAPKEVRNKYKEDLLKYKQLLEGKKVLYIDDDYLKYYKKIKYHLDERNGWLPYYLTLKFIDYLLNDSNASLNEFKNLKSLLKYMSYVRDTGFHSLEDYIYISYLIHFFFKDINFGRSKLFKKRYN